MIENYPESAKVSADASPEAPHWTSDLGFADKLAIHYGRVIRYDHSREKWLVFDDATGWKHDNGSALRGLVHNHVRTLIKWALKQAGQPSPGENAEGTDGAKQAAKRISVMIDLGDTRRITNALTELKSFPRLAVRAEQIDSEPHLIGLPNGVYDLNSDRFSMHSESVITTLRLGVPFDLGAECPEFLKFLQRVQPDPSMRGFLQRLAGSLLRAGNSDQTLPFFHGGGANGKSTFTEAVAHVLGSYARSLTESLLYTKGAPRPPELEIAGLYGSRLAIGTENSAGEGLNEGLLKSLTGGDRVKGRFHYQDFVEFTPTFKIWLVGNHKPRIAGTDCGIWRRFLLVDWPVKILDDERDCLLKVKLQAEASGIFNWLLEGYRQWSAGGLKPPTSCTELTEEFRRESDTLLEFVREYTEEAPGATVTKADVFGAYQAWADTSGIRHKLTKSSLTSRLRLRDWVETMLAHGRQGAWLNRKLRARIDPGAR